MKRPRLVLLFVGLAAAAALLALQTARWARDAALTDLAERSAQTLRLVTDNLTGELGKHSFQPGLLATHPSVRRALAHPDDAAAISDLNIELERINAITGALDTYVMTRDGTTIAASNWASDRPFIGRSFAFRPYFKAAIQGVLGRYYALGTTSGERGYYFAHPVRQGQDIIGVTVTKMDVGRLEAEWINGDAEILVVDGDGVVFLSSRPDWRLKTLAPLDAETADRITLSRRYEGVRLEPLAITPGDAPDVVRIAGTSGARPPAVREEFVRVSAPMAAAGWTVHILAATSEVATRVRLAVAVVTLLLATLILASAILVQRRRRLAERMALQEAARAELEVKVDERTRDLVAVNDILRSEIAERERAETNLRRTQDELIQASKLTALGQLSAGLSHELNQPLAAIRTYADNARAFLERNQSATAAENLAGIAELTERMARIIRNLRNYARSEPVAVRPVRLARAIVEAQALLAQRFEAERVAVTFDPDSAEILVLGGDVRLQQVFVNLLSNAIDALSLLPRGKPRRIEITIIPTDREAIVTIADTGPGISEEHLPRIFDPFFSTKPAGKGTGLGLSITYRIVQELGGQIRAANRTTGGAAFTLVLRRAEALEEAAE